MLLPKEVREHGDGPFTFNSVGRINKPKTSGRRLEDVDCHLVANTQFVVLSWNE